METVAWKLELPPVPRDDEMDALENRLALATERAETAEAQLGRAFEAVKALAGRIERKTLQAYDKGFEAGVAFAIADEARRSEPRRKVIERDEAGRIVAVVG